MTLPSVSEAPNKRRRYTAEFKARIVADCQQPNASVARIALKHNLNARAIGALRGEVDGLERDVTALRKRMQAAIARSDAFIAELNRQDAP